MRVRVVKQVGSAGPSHRHDICSDEVVTYSESYLLKYQHQSPWMKSLYNNGFFISEDYDETILYLDMDREDIKISKHYSNYGKIYGIIISQIRENKICKIIGE